LIIKYNNLLSIKSKINKTLNKMNEEFEREYINSLSEKEKKALEIAKNHLGTLFTLCKTTGYIQWKKKTEKKE
jgi:hypothetical protein